jgi:hypothetical protein
MGLFHNFLQDLELTKLQLQSPVYLSNEPTHPMLEWIYCAFAYVPLCDQFPSHRLRAVSPSSPPILVHTNAKRLGKSRFKFESIMPRFPSFLEVVAVLNDGNLSA